MLHFVAPTVAQKKEKEMSAYSLFVCFLCREVHIWRETAGAFDKTAGNGEWHLLVFHDSDTTN